MTEIKDNPNLHYVAKIMELVQTHSDLQVEVHSLIAKGDGQAACRLVHEMHATSQEICNLILDFLPEKLLKATEGKEEKYSWENPCSEYEDVD